MASRSGDQSYPHRQPRQQQQHVCRNQRHHKQVTATHPHTQQRQPRIHRTHTQQRQSPIHTYATATATIHTYTTATVTHTHIRNSDSHPYTHTQQRQPPYTHTQQRQSPIHTYTTATAITHHGRPECCYELLGTSTHRHERVSTYEHQLQRHRRQVGTGQRVQLGDAWHRG